VRLAAEADWVELANVVDKKRSALNPHPTQDFLTDEFAQHGGKESIQFAFPFAVADGEIRMDIPLGMMRPEADQLPGSCKNWLSVGRWIDVANPTQGVTWITLDAPLVEIGEISATMLGSQKDPAKWRKHIEPAQRFYSWVMNNHWETNYRAYQEGPVEFRYALRPHTGYNSAAASRLAIGMSEPLLVSVANSDPTQPPLLRVEPADVLALTLKQSDDAGALIIRLFGASGEKRNAKLIWPSPTAPKLWRSNLSEERVEAIHGEITVAAWDLITIRVDRT
jgi:alpha-mannosidase